MKYHFKAFKLSALYASHAAEELASIEYIAKRIYDGGSIELKKYLTETAAGKKSVSLNSWQSALYSCLSENNWFVRLDLDSNKDIQPISGKSHWMSY